MRRGQLRPGQWLVSCNEWRSCEAGDNSPDFTMGWVAAEGIWSVVSFLRFLLELLVARMGFSQRWGNGR